MIEDHLDRRRVGAPSADGNPKRGGHDDPSPTRSVWRRWAMVAVAGVAILGGGYVGLTAYIAERFTRPDPRPRDAVPVELKVPHEEVAFASRGDHVPLAGCLAVPAEGAPRRAPVVISHPLGGDRHWPPLTALAQALYDSGHPVLLIDYRGAGDSAPVRRTLGNKELWDLGGGIDLLRARGLASTGVELLGVSMGGAIALRFAAEEPQVLAVVTDSTFAEFSQVLEAGIPRATGLPSLFTPGVMWSARWLLDIDVFAVRPIAAMAALRERKVPYLQIHGEADQTVPIAQAHRLAQAYGAGVATWYLPGVDHSDGFAAQGERYVRRVVDYLDAYAPAHASKAP